MSIKKSTGYTIQPIPVMRRFSVDNRWLARQRHTIHGLIELDVTEARQLIQLHKTQTGETISFTGFIVHCLARAADESKEVSAYRDWRDRLVIFDQVITRQPGLIREIMSPVMVTAVGMFGKGGGIPTDGDVGWYSDKTWRGIREG